MTAAGAVDVGDEVKVEWEAGAEGVEVVADADVLVCQGFHHQEPVHRCVGEWLVQFEFFVYICGSFSACVRRIRLKLFSFLFACVRFSSMASSMHLSGCART